MPPELLAWLLPLARCSRGCQAGPHFIGDPPLRALSACGSGYLGKRSPFGLGLGEGQPEPGPAGCGSRVDCTFPGACVGAAPNIRKDGSTLVVLRLRL